jgi:hypothetical protein
MNIHSFEIAFSWGPDPIWLHTTLEDMWPHYMILDVCWDGLWTLSFGLSQFRGHGSWLVCEVALIDMIRLVMCSISHTYIHTQGCIYMCVCVCWWGTQDTVCVHLLQGIVFILFGVVVWSDESSWAYKFLTLFFLFLFFSQCRDYGGRPRMIGCGLKFRTNRVLGRAPGPTNTYWVRPNMWKVRFLGFWKNTYMFVFCCVMPE